MCGRFALATPVNELAAEMDTEPLSDLTPFKPSWNVAPQRFIPVATEVGVQGEEQVKRHFRLMRWGFRPSWAKPSRREPINARSETHCTRSRCFVQPLNAVEASSRLTDGTNG